MRQFMHSCYFIISSPWTRLRNWQFILYTLITVLTALAIVQSGLHTATHIHMPLLSDTSDPWNG
jgi:hypothetical protein